MNNQYQKDFRKIISRHSKAHDTPVITGSEEGLGKFRLHYQFFFSLHNFYFCKFCSLLWGFLEHFFWTFQLSYSINFWQFIPEWLIMLPNN